MILKAMDLSLMAEHLNTHKAVIEKLNLFFCSVENPELRQVLYEQIVIMDNHVRVMISLMDPQINESITVSI
jgi:spore coat protein CotF